MGLLDQLQAYIKANTPRSTRPPVSPATVIDQGLFGGRVGQIPQRAEEMKQGLLNVPRDLAQLGSPEMSQQVNQAMQNPQQFDKEKGMQMAMDYLQTTNPMGGLLAHTVYHGSPHKFNKFDMSKIGTGEGAQAYGHGLYFAESQGVAKSYAEDLAKAKGNPLVIRKAGKVYKEGDDLTGEVLDALKYREIGAKDAGQFPHNTDYYARKRVEGMPEGPYRDRVMAALDDLKDTTSAYEKSTGQMYKVDIPDESIPRMLDWDAPLSKQPEGVRVAVQDLGLPANATGQDAYNALANLARDGAIARGNNAATTLGGSQSAASVDLQGYGIPGIRYLDGNSRGVGGTSNFVLFDDQLARILEVNGQPTGLLSWADEAAQKKAGLLDVGDKQDDVFSYLTNKTKAKINDELPYDSDLGRSVIADFDNAKVQLSMREEGNVVYMTNIQTKDITDLAKKAKGTGRGTEILNAAREYADKTGKKLVIQDATGPAMPYWNKQKWLVKQKPVKKADGYLEQNYTYDPKQRQNN